MKRGINSKNIIKKSFMALIYATINIVRKPLLILTLLILSLAFLAILSLPDKYLHVIFCDVGQGDAILATLGTNQILVDGGPDDKVIFCLSRHMPFWDRKVEIVVNTHPQEDHYRGLVDVLRKYQVGTFLRPEVEGTSAGWEALKAELHKRNVTQNYAGAGQKIRISGLSFDILYPSESLIGGDLNEYSVVGILSYWNFDTLLTGDIIPPATDMAAQSVRPVEVLKVPHHGSKNGLTPKLLKLAAPKLAVISVGKNNRYGHPHEEVIQMLREVGEIRVLRTDVDGEVEIVSDGQKWWVDK